MMRRLLIALIIFGGVYAGLHFGYQEGYHDGWNNCSSEINQNLVVGLIYNDLPTYPHSYYIKYNGWHEIIATDRSDAIRRFMECIR